MAERRTRAREDIVFFLTAAEFRDWLAANHESPDELWVGFFKKASGLPSITYSEAVDEALCFGWIDGIRLAVDGECFTNRFTHRKPASNWSAVNVKRVGALLDAGRMQPSGIAAFEARDPEKTQQPGAARGAGLSAEYESWLRQRKEAWAFFEAQPPWYRRTAGFWVMSAKQEKTRRRRLQQLADDSSTGLWVKPLRRGQPAGRGDAGNLSMPRVV